EFEQADRPSAGRLDLLSGGLRRPESGDGYGRRDLAGRKDHPGDDDLLALDRVPAEPGQVDLRPILARPFEALGDVPPDPPAGLAGDLPEFADDTLEGRIRLRGLGHGKCVPVRR